MKNDQTGQKQVSSNILIVQKQKHVFLPYLVSNVTHIGTGTTPVHSPLPKDDPLSLLRQQALFMQRSALQDLKEIGEGRWVFEAIDIDTTVCP